MSKMRAITEPENIEWIEEGEEEDDARVELGLVGRLWTNRNVNINAFMSTIKNAWQPKHGVEISNIGKNMFVFQFHHWRDKHRVIEDQPWHFDWHALLLGDVDSSGKPSDIQYYTTFPCGLESTIYLSRVV
ncbi:GTPase Der [Bienertia sinuspersici]